MCVCVCVCARAHACGWMRECVKAKRIGIAAFNVIFTLMQLLQCRTYSFNSPSKDRWERLYEGSKWNESLVTYTCLIQSLSLIWVHWHVNSWPNYVWIIPTSLVGWLSSLVPICMPRDQLSSAEHLLTECVDWIEWRRQVFKTRVTVDVVPWVTSGQHCSVFGTNQFISQTDCTIVHTLLRVLFSVIAVHWFFFKFCRFNCIKRHILLTSRVLFWIMCKVWSVYHLEVTVPVGWALKTNK